MSSSAYVWHFEAFYRYLPFLLAGVRYTVLVSVLAILFGLVVGLASAIIRLYGPRPFGWLTAFYIDFVRSTPLLVQLVWVFFALPILIDRSLPPLMAGVLTLGVYSGAYLAEIFRAGIIAIPSGQRHAGLALGMTGRQVVWRIILPQAVVRMLPPVASTFISLVKDSSLVSVISVAELMWASQSLVGFTMRPVEVLTGTAFLYVALTYPLSLAAGVLRRRYLAV
jgi:His/Glu/Gln/Arg/opine family amino acid ABC transporter permease subunit